MLIYGRNLWKRDCKILPLDRYTSKMKLGNEGEKMSVLIVGGDRLGSIPKELHKFGFTEVHHLSGRGNQKVHNRIPQSPEFIIVLYDYVNHNLAGKIKRFAVNGGIPIIYAKRSWSSICAKIMENRRQADKAAERGEPQKTRMARIEIEDLR